MTEDDNALYGLELAEAREILEPLYTQIDFFTHFFPLGVHNAVEAFEDALCDCIDGNPPEGIIGEYIREWYLKTDTHNHFYILEIEKLRALIAKDFGVEVNQMNALISSQVSVFYN